MLLKDYLLIQACTHVIIIHEDFRYFHNEDQDVILNLKKRVRISSDLNPDKTLAAQLGIDDLPFFIRHRGDLIYTEQAHGSWFKYRFNNNHQITYKLDMNNFWEKYDYDNYGNEIRYTNSEGYSYPE